MVAKPDEDEEKGEKNTQPGATATSRYLLDLLEQISPPHYSSTSATPSVTEMASNAPESSPISRDATPCPGERFIILHKASNRPVAVLEGGVLQLADEPYDFSWPAFLDNSCIVRNAGNIHHTWLCVEKNGWLGFRGHLGRYIGQSAEPKKNRHILKATMKHHKSWEYFCPRRHPGGGGYILMSPNEEDYVKPWLCKLFKVEVDLCDKSTS